MHAHGGITWRMLCNMLQFVAQPLETSSDARCVKPNWLTTWLKDLQTRKANDGPERKLQFLG